MCEKHEKETDIMAKNTEKKMLSIKAKVYSFALKFYDEQLPFGIQHTVNAIQTLDKRNYQVLMICHYRDEVSDGIWEIAREKQHYHLILRCSDKKCRIRIKQMLDYFGIMFRQGVDDSLIMNHAIETVGDFRAYSMYLTHETIEAEKDNKERYDVAEIVSNLSLEEIKAVRDGYFRIADASAKVTMSTLSQLDEEAFNLGHELKDFNAWYNSLNFTIRANSKMKVIRESYERGVESLLEENPQVTRLCVFIQGEPNTGKTYATKAALAGKEILSIGGGGSGKFDKLKPSTDVIVIDDDICTNLLNMSDNYLCHAYRRGANNPVWAGKYLIVTSNLSFSDWLRACGIKIPDSSTTVAYRMANCNHYDALLSRFYICCIKKDEVSGVNRLALASASTRGSMNEQQERLKMFLEFQKKFNATISQYTPQHIDYSGYIDFECCLNEIL